MLNELLFRLGIRIFSGGVNGKKLPAGISGAKTAGTVFLAKK
jgi:hypothetical protein